MLCYLELITLFYTVPRELHDKLHHRFDEPCEILAFLHYLLNQALTFAGNCFHLCTELNPRY